MGADQLLLSLSNRKALHNVPFHPSNVKNVPLLDLLQKSEGMTLKMLTH